MPCSAACHRVVVDSAYTMLYCMLLRRWWALLCSTAYRRLDDGCCNALYAAMKKVSLVLPTGIEQTK